MNILPNFDDIKLLSNITAPYCLQCKVPVERYYLTVEPAKQRVAVTAHCHGQEESRVVRPGEPVGMMLVFKQRSGFNGHDIAEDWVQT